MRRNCCADPDFPIAHELATIERLTEVPMLHLRRPLARMCLLAVGALAGVLVPASARAGEGEPASVQSRWRLTSPTLSLQPEVARVFLTVPPELLPPPELWWLRPFELGGSGHVFIYLPAQIQVVDRSRSLGFGVTVLPRAAVAELRFDPLPAWIR
jgi:hypothetical protein